MWLDEIEITSKKNRELRENCIGGLLDEMDSERMARVLKELATIINTMVPYMATTMVFEMYDSISDDAKALLKIGDA